MSDFVIESSVTPMPADTIVAIATPAGRGGVGIVRMSGPQALQIAFQISTKSTFTPRQATVAKFFDEQHEVIDEGIVIYFKGPHSFTGEDVVEFQSHGAPVVLDRLVKRCLFFGARVARPGEYSLRAFLNDKMDLTQAEAVADLINASSETAAKLAVKSLQGEFSKRIHELNEQIIQLRLYVEASIDFSDEEIDVLSEGVVTKRLDALLVTLATIQKQATQGALLREGLSVVIAGAPNAGKSTLINQLSGRDVAIVTDIPGTTRDVMREYIDLDDLPIHIIDTAGLRDSHDPIEQEGIKRAVSEIRLADCILWVSDATSDPQEVQLQQLIEAENLVAVPIIKIINKTDLIPKLPHVEGDKVYLSAKTGEGIAFLKDKIKAMVGYQPGEGLFLARRRHLQALVLAQELLQQGQQQLQQVSALELLAEDLRQAHQALSEITGEFSSDELLGKIFSTFCIGK